MIKNLSKQVVKIKFELEISISVVFMINLSERLQQLRKLIRNKCKDI